MFPVWLYSKTLAKAGMKLNFFFPQKMLADHKFFFFFNLSTITNMLAIHVPYKTYLGCSNLKKKMYKIPNEKDL